MYKPRTILQFNDILQSTFCISVSERLGTCFVCRLNEHRIIIITCKHLFPNNNNGDTVNFGFKQYDGKFNNFSGVLLWSQICDDDICAVIVNDSKFVCAISFNTFEISNRVFMGDEVFVLGFPFIMKNKKFNPEPMFISDTIYPQAILRHGYVSSPSISNVPIGEQRITRILLDLYNNPGFSGSPIIKRGYFGTMNFGYIPIGIMSGYYNDEFDNKIEKNTNSGISYGYSFDIIWRQIMNYK